LEEDKFTEFSTEETVNRTKRSSMFTVLRIEAVQKTRPTVYKIRLMKLQNILHILHPNPIRLPRTTILLFPQSFFIVLQWI